MERPSKWLVEYEGAPLSLHTEFLSHAEDFPEQTVTSCPLITRVLSIEDAEVDTSYPFTAVHGVPAWIYITHNGEYRPLRFTLSVGGRKSTTLENMDHFDQFKLIARAACHYSDYQYDTWVYEKRPVLLRVEELGLFGEVSQWEDRVLFELEMLDDGVDVNVYLVYEHHVCTDEKAFTNFGFLNQNS